MSADVHKYGLGPKVCLHPMYMYTVPTTVVTSCFGAVHRVSVVLYWTGEYRRYQILACSDWIGGLYGSPIMGGTRPGNE